MPTCDMTQWQIFTQFVVNILYLTCSLISGQEIKFSVLT